MADAPEPPRRNPADERSARRSRRGEQAAASTGDTRSGDSDRNEALRDTELGKACREHLEFVRRNCPDLLPGGPLTPGESAPDVEVAVDRLGALMGAALRSAAAGPSRSVSLAAHAPPTAVVWTSGADELLVLLDSVKVSTAEGVVTVGITVGCDELARRNDRPTAPVEIDLVVGTTDRPTGLLAAAPPPRGPAVVVDRWGDALIGLAWQALLDSAAGLSAEVGVDAHGVGLVPTAWTASERGFTVAPQARHPIDSRTVTAAQP